MKLTTKNYEHYQIQQILNTLRQMYAKYCNPTLTKQNDFDIYTGAKHHDYLLSAREMMVDLFEAVMLLCCVENFRRDDVGSFDRWWSTHSYRHRH